MKQNKAGKNDEILISQKIGDQKYTLQNGQPSPNLTSFSDHQSADRTASLPESKVNTKASNEFANPFANSLGLNGFGKNEHPNPGFSSFQKTRTVPTKKGQNKEATSLEGV